MKCFLISMILIGLKFRQGHNNWAWDILCRDHLCLDYHGSLFCRGPLIESWGSWGHEGIKVIWGRQTFFDSNIWSNRQKMCQCVCLIETLPLTCHIPLTLTWSVDLDLRSYLRLTFWRHPISFDARWQNERDGSLIDSHPHEVRSCPRKAFFVKNGDFSFDGVLTLRRCSWF